MMVPSDDTTLAWHFLQSHGRLRDGTEPPDDGVEMYFRGRIQLGKRGLHASERATDAIAYAPGPTVCRVLCRGSIHGKRQMVSRERRILWRADASDSLREWAFRSAQGVMNVWPDAPDDVRLYMAGDRMLSGDAMRAALDCKERLSDRVESAVAGSVAYAAGAECAEPDNVPRLAYMAANSAVAAAVAFVCLKEIEKPRHGGSLVDRYLAFERASQPFEWRQKEEDIKALLTSLCPSSETLLASAHVKGARQ